MNYPTIEDAIGRTPLVALQRIGAEANRARGNVVLGKLEGNNPAGSVKDRPALSMIKRAEERGDIQPGDTLIEATSGNTGIALAMAAAIKGYRMVLIMPEDLSIERAQTMKAFGAELILTPKSGGMEYARDLADKLEKEGKGRVLDQFANADNPRIHYETTGPELWDQTGGRITHFVSAMGTTGTITGVSRFLKEKNPAIRVIGAQPADGSRIPGIRKWPQEYLPKIYDPSGVDELVLVSQSDAEDMCRRHGARRGHLCWHFGRRCLLGGATDRCPGGERHHRLRGLRPGRPLPVDRRLSGLRPVRAMSAEYRFCPSCAAPLSLVTAQEDGGPKERLRCTACDFTHWNNPTPVLAAIVQVGGKVLLARNAAWQHRMFALITGFMEAGETPEEGIRREIAEETGLTVTALKLVGVHDFQRMNQVIITYHAIAEGTVVLSPELVEYKLLEPHQVRCWPAGTGLALADWLRGAGNRTSVHGNPACVTYLFTN